MVDPSLFTGRYDDSLCAALAEQGAQVTQVAQRVGFEGGEFFAGLREWRHVGGLGGGVGLDDEVAAVVVEGEGVQLPGPVDDT